MFERFTDRARRVIVPQTVYKDDIQRIQEILDNLESHQRKAIIAYLREWYK
jgi:hypothetical protein